MVVPKLSGQNRLNIRIENSTVTPIGTAILSKRLPYTENNPDEGKARVGHGDFAPSRRGRTDARAIVKAATLVML